MRRFSAVFALVTGIAMSASLSTSTIAGTLYQWTGKDGTPTYSPDPPPAGVNYELVGADLQPLPKNTDATKATQTATATTVSRAPKAPVAPPQGQSAENAGQNPSLMQQAAQLATQEPAQQPAQQAPKKPIVPWKPVRYANDPNPAKKAQVRTSAANAPDPVSIARNSPACASARQKMALLEGQFAQSVTDEQMDAAILQLREHKPAFKAACKIN